MKASLHPWLCLPLHDIVLHIILEPVIKDLTVQEWVLVFKPVCVLLFISDPPSADLDQLELPVLCDGLRRYLQDLPQPIIPTAVYAQMVLTAKGENRRQCRFNDLLFTVQLAWNWSADVMYPCPAIEHSVLWTQNHKTSLTPNGLQRGLLLSLFSLYILFPRYNIQDISHELAAFSYASVCLAVSVASTDKILTPHTVLQCCILLPSHGQKQDICG